MYTGERLTRGVFESLVSHAEPPPPLTVSSNPYRPFSAPSTSKSVMRAKPIELYTIFATHSGRVNGTAAQPPSRLSCMKEFGVY